MNKNNNFKIYNYVEKTKVRAMILCPPLILCILGIIVAIEHARCNYCFIITTITQYTFILSAIWLMFALLFLLWCDYKRFNEKYK